MGSLEVLATREELTFPWGVHSAVYVYGWAKEVGGVPPLKRSRGTTAPTRDPGQVCPEKLRLITEAAGLSALSVRHLPWVRLYRSTRTLSTVAKFGEPPVGGRALAEGVSTEHLDPVRFFTTIHEFREYDPDTQLDHWSAELFFRTNMHRLNIGEPRTRGAGGARGRKAGTKEGRKGKEEKRESARQ